MLESNFLLSILLLGLLSYPQISNGLGINCKGSSSCGAVDGTLQAIVDMVCNLPNGPAGFPPGVRLAQYCDRFAGGIAAFTQNTKTFVTPGKACSLLQLLKKHGCGTCGSIPLDYPHSNDVNKGELTVNYVLKC